jgi:hypothetical protein
MTLKEHFAQKLANLEAAFVAEKAKIEAEMAGVGPLVEHDIDALRQWIANAAAHLGL